MNKIRLINEILMKMEYYYDIFIKNQNFNELCKEYNLSLINKGKTVKIIENGDYYTGVALGINEKGELLVKTELLREGILESVVKEVVSGEVSVRGVYGYV